MKIFPSTVKPMSAMSGGLMSHVRYPEDLFKVQRTVLAQYHVTDPNAFFGGQDYWQVPSDPTDQSSAAGAQPPYYLTLQMPDQEKATFSLTGDVHPQERTSSVRNVLTGYLAVDSDAGSSAGQRRHDYGTLRLLQLPKDTAVPAPGSGAEHFKSNPGVSSLLNVLGLSGDQAAVRQPAHPAAGQRPALRAARLRAARRRQGAFPQLQRVLVAFGDKIGFASTLPCALDQVFGGGATGQQCTTPQPGGERAGNDSHRPRRRRRAAARRRRRRPVRPARRRWRRSWRRR